MKQIDCTPTPEECVDMANFNLALMDSLVLAGHEPGFYAHLRSYVDIYRALIQSGFDVTVEKNGRLKLNDIG